MFFKKGVLINFTDFTGKQQWWSFYEKKTPARVLFCENCKVFKKYQFWRTSAKGCFCLHFLCSMVCTYAWIHNFRCAYTFAITDVTFSGISWWVNNHVYFVFEQTFLRVLSSTPCSFCWLFSKLIWTNIFFQWSLLLCFLSSACCSFVF